jgi:hypothetical protein
VSSFLCLGRFDQHAAKNLSSKMMTWVFAATHSPERWADRETGRSSSCARHARLAERENHSPAFKATVALAAVKGEKTLVELARQFRRSRQPDHAMEGAASASASARLARSDVDGGCAGSSLFDADALCSGEPNVFVGPSDPFRHQDSAIVRASSVLRHSTAQLYMLYW